VTLSLPSRGAWIETSDALGGDEDKRRRSLHGERGLKRVTASNGKQVTGSLPSRGAWIETGVMQFGPSLDKSLPSRGAWIETYNNNTGETRHIVAPFTGSVD